MTNLGRRGLAANMWVMKMAGAAAEAGSSFEECLSIGGAVNGNAVTVGSSLDHCHIPGREHHRAIPDNAYVLGMGVHNEPGLHEVNPMPPVEEIVADMLKYCLDPKDEDNGLESDDECKDDSQLLQDGIGDEDDGDDEEGEEDHARSHPNRRRPLPAWLQAAFDACIVSGLDCVHCAA